MKEKILNIIKDEHYIPITKEDFVTMFNASEEEITKALFELRDEYVIKETKKHKFDLLSRYNIFLGIIDIKEQGFGFIRMQSDDSTNEDYYVHKSNTLGAYKMDLVLFQIINDDNDFGYRKEAIVLKIVKRGLTFDIGRISISKRGNLIFKSDNNQKIFFDIEDFKEVVVGDIVQVEVDEFVTSLRVRAHINKVLGNIDDPRIDILSIAYKYGFENEFNDDVIEEVRNCNVDVLKESKIRRKVERNIITIDGDHAKDLDDAVSIVKLENGNYSLGVYIADVSFYVKEDSALDKEALKRGNSVYLADSVIPMLPHKLCNDWCSLNEKELKLVIACEMEIDNKGKVLNQDIFEAAINSMHRMTYNNVNKMLEDNDQTIINEYCDIYNDLLLMKELSKILRERRIKRGSFDFDVNESEIICDEKGNVIDVRLRSRGTGEKLIEEFMICANEVVANTITNLNLPFIYRVHDKPNEIKLNNFIELCKNFGYDTTIRKNKTNPKSLHNLLSNLIEKDKILTSVLLKSMAKARYSENNIGHYGLASLCYTHFTSPIRRYSDLLCHRLIRSYLFKGEVDIKHQKNNLIKITKIAEIISKKERDAIDCEYEVEDMKTAEYMESHIGERYCATISSITNFGMFCTLENNIEGLIHVSNMKGYFSYNANKMIMRSDRKTYHLGDRIDIIVNNASKKEHLIDFVINEKDSVNCRKRQKR